MNRQQRRAAARLARKAPVEPVTAIHEAAHAVFAVLFAPSAGWPSPNGALNHIDLYSKPTVGTEESLETGGALAGWTDLQFCPPEMAAYLQPVLKKIAEGEPSTWEALVPAFEQMRAAGIDLQGWLRVKFLIAVAGAAAEAKATGQSTDDVLTSPVCSSDWQGIKRDCLLCGLEHEEAFAEIARALSHTEQIVEDHPEVWGAITRLGARLKIGRMSAAEAVKIIYSDQQRAA